MEEKIKPIKKIIVWSDGMAAQFRSRFVFMLLSTIDHAIDLEWHYNEAHHGKGPMNGVGGAIKNSVFRAAKSGKISVRDPEEFVKAANDVVPSIRSIYMPIVDMLEEPLEVANAPVIPETLQVHKIVREITKENIPFIKFFKLSRNDTPAYTQYCSLGIGPQVCSHPDRNVDDNTCAHCLADYKVGNEEEEWLCCPLCTKWFHESCFDEL